VAPPDDLAPELHGAPVGQRGGVDAAADAIAGLEHHDVGAAAHEVARRRQSRQTGSQHRHIGHGSSPLTKPQRSRLDSRRRAA
jgi:hypothetical protein